MDDARQLLTPKTVCRLMGVIDLKGGQAVHAVAGNREQYRPVSAVNGDASCLARRYFELGIRGIYIADLDGIERASPQVDQLACLLDECRLFDQVVLDFGWDGTFDGIAELLLLPLANARWVVATESVACVKGLYEACRVIDPKRLVLSLDYRQGKFLNSSDRESAWLEAAASVGVGGVIVLDLADVGTATGGSTVPTCQRVKLALPNAMLYSGGGIRNTSDVQSFVDAGSDRCLVATCIQRLLVG